MRSLSFREYFLIVIMLLLMAVAGGMFGFQKLEERHLQVQARFSLKQQQLEMVKQLEQEWLTLNRHPILPTLPQSLNALIENAAQKFEVKTQLQLNPITNPPQGMEGIRVRLDQLNLDQMFEVLFFLENHKPVLLIEQLEIITIPGSNLIRFSFRLYKQTQT